MAKVKQSFLSNLLGRNNYNEFKDYAKIIIAIGTCILAIVLPLTLFLHWSFISSLLNWFTGTSLTFIAYIASLILVLDIEVDVEEDESYSCQEPEKKPKPISYKLTIAWGVILIALGIAAIYFSNRYRMHYAFECDTFLVDHQHQMYHLDCNNRCEIAIETDGLEKMKGYEIEASYTICDWCKEWAEDAESEYESDRYFRR